MINLRSFLKRNSDIRIIKTEKVHFVGTSKECGVDVKVDGSVKVIEFVDVAMGELATAYYSPDNEWIIYYYNNENNEHNWAAVSQDVKSRLGYKEIFLNFSQYCAENATVPMFDKVDTNIKM